MQALGLAGLKQGVCMDSGTAPRGAHARAWAARAPWALGHLVLPRRQASGALSLSECAPPCFTPGWSTEHSSWCHGLCLQAWSRAQWPIFSLVPLFTGLQPGPGVWEAGCGRGFAPLRWLHPCLASPGGGGGGDGSLGELQPEAGLSLPRPGGGMGRHMAVALSQCCWVWKAGGDVAGGVEISACGFPNILPACHRTACQDPGCQAQPGPPSRGAWLLVCSPAAAQGAGRGRDVRAR